MTDTTATAYAAPTLYGRVRVLKSVSGNRYRVITLGEGVGGWAKAGKILFLPAYRLNDIVGELPSFEPPAAPAAPAALPETWYVLRGSRRAHYATSTEQDERDGVVRPICGKLNPMPGFRVRETRAADYDCPDCAEKLGDFYLPRPERDPADRRAEIAAFCAMSATASRITDARMNGDAVEMADLRGRMNDLRAAYSISLGTPLDLVDRNGYSKL